MEKQRLREVVQNLFNELIPEKVKQRREIAEKMEQYKTLVKNLAAEVEQLKTSFEKLEIEKEKLAVAVERLMNSFEKLAVAWERFKLRKKIAEHLDNTIKTSQ